MREAADMANAGAAKELTGYRDAFAVRDWLKRAEEAAERERQARRASKAKP